MLSTFFWVDLKRNTTPCLITFEVLMSKADRRVYLITEEPEGVEVNSYKIDRCHRESNLNISYPSTHRVIMADLFSFHSPLIQTIGCRKGDWIDLFLPIVLDFWCPSWICCVVDNNLYADHSRLMWWFGVSAVALVTSCTCDCLPFPHSFSWLFLMNSLWLYSPCGEQPLWLHL